MEIMVKKVLLGTLILSLLVMLTLPNRAYAAEQIKDQSVQTSEEVKEQAKEDVVAKGQNEDQEVVEIVAEETALAGPKQGGSGPLLWGMLLVPLAAAGITAHLVKKTNQLNN